MAADGPGIDESAACESRIGALGLRLAGAGAAALPLPVEDEVVARPPPCLPVLLG
ncbi:MAG: hypothetical protein WD232_03600 [Acidimicrobiales bacterium]